MTESSGSADLAALAAAAQEAGVTADGATANVVTVPMLFLRVGTRWMAVRATDVREVAAKGAVVPVPTAPAHVLGVTLVRGRLVPVVSLEILMGGQGAGEAATTLPRLVVLRSEDSEIAVVAEETRGIEEEPPTTVPSAEGADRPTFVAGELDWRGNLVCLLDVPSLIAVASGGGAS